MFDAITFKSVKTGIGGAVITSFKYKVDKYQNDVYLFYAGDKITSWGSCMEDEDITSSVYH